MRLLLCAWVQKAAETRSPGIFSQGGIDVLPTRGRQKGKGLNSWSMLGDLRSGERHAAIEFVNQM